MSVNFKDYTIVIVKSNNYPGKFVASIEEFHNVITIIDNKEKASQLLKPLFNREIKRLSKINNTIPKPGSGKAKITTASNYKIFSLGQFFNEFWDKIVGPAFPVHFISDESYFDDLEYFSDAAGKQKLIDKVKFVYNYDIEPIYNKPINEILFAIMKSNSS